MFKLSIFFIITTAFALKNKPICNLNKPIRIVFKGINNDDSINLAVKNYCKIKKITLFKDLEEELAYHDRTCAPQVAKDLNEAIKNNNGKPDMGRILRRYEISYINTYVFSYKASGGIDTIKIYNIGNPNLLQYKEVIITDSSFLAQPRTQLMERLMDTTVYILCNKVKGKGYINLYR
jgi:hypothetical protein